MLADFFCHTEVIAQHLRCHVQPFTLKEPASTRMIRLLRVFQLTAFGEVHVFLLRAASGASDASFFVRGVDTTVVCTTRRSYTRTALCSSINYIAHLLYLHVWPSSPFYL